MQKSEPVRILSQTTQLALDAQRMRRRLRAEKQKQSQPNQAPSIGNQISSGAFALLLADQTDSLAEVLTNFCGAPVPQPELQP